MLPRTMTMFRITLMTTDWIYTRRFSGMKAEHMIYFNTVNRQLVSQESLLEFLLLAILRLRLSKSSKRRILNRMWTLLIFRNIIRHFFFKNHGTQYTPQLETLFTNIAEHLTTYFYWSSPQNCNFSKVRHRLPDDGPCGPKHVGAIMRYFNCIF